MEECVFCRIISGRIPALKVHEDEKVSCFLDIQPANPGHALVVTKDHYPTLAETPDEELGRLFSAVKKAGRAAVAAVGAAGYNVVVNNGAVAGQIIPHVHVHVIPRFEDDGHRHWAKKSVEPERMKEISEKMNKLLS